ncbi:recombinase zinc beta ribbon domain-containing protein, partial [Candidatus Nomurabacteria bacterium]|nr:recombinase zinc beta ribbon domain-containing protein [Candidatus Nomurabacteria bacterium]
MRISSHEPIISKKLFDSAQAVLKSRGRPDRKSKNEPQPFCGLLRCAECGMMITGEYKVKKQKNGNTHEYIYYHCSKKSKTKKCLQPCIRQEELDRQLSSEIQKVSLPKDWEEELLKMAEKEFNNSAQSLTACVKENEVKLNIISQKLERLLNGYLDQVIDELDYRKQKSKLLLEKKSLEEKMTSLSRKQNNWLEPMREWIKEAQNLDGIARDTDLF